MALVTAIMATLVVGVLGATLLLGTTAETLMAENFLRSIEAHYATEAGLERAVSDIEASSDWTGLLAGVASSSAVDGPPGGSRRLSDGSRVDLGEIVNLANCGHASSCGDAELGSAGAERRWGPNNPRWRLFVHAPLAQLLPPNPGLAPFYVVVLVGDDPMENDNAPLVDGGAPATGELENPGTGTVVLRGEAFGPRGAHARIDATVARGRGVVSWWAAR